ncbi:NAD-specific glutamate dehydrogenase [Roseomonas mucosa]|uniref:NAD-glutamate dehydrogenase n=3 Tax=Roseomonas mucosa TaxID=207340 RepID=UPI001238DD94|nr:NAD-glutamate dehydrogenase domain-containing protein [Roseomonas mucosa]QDD96727.1 NAD-specific glutamate dehydrogenase [Roseomonas mucosa]QET94351.1 NAD-glutamate dehydrogenase [Roseomonas mucosa]UZO94016.1 NAD-specific glutamate dehydrogenase [Roseomonas mucosa]
MPQDASPAGRGVEQEAGRQTGAGTGPDRLREEILGAAGEAARRLAPALPEDLPVLLRHLFEALPTAELAAESPEALAAAAISLWSLASERRPAEAKLRLQPPGPGRGGALLEIVTDDMPFLVDSAMAALTLSGRTVRRLLHPVMTVRRDAGGRLLGFGPQEPAESMMRIEISPAPARLLGEDAAPPEDWPGVEATLRRTLADLRQAVSDYPAMRAQLRLAAQDVAGAPSGAEASDFLRWLDEDNFVLLGHRRLRLEAPDGVAPGGTTPAGTREDEGLGLLRDPALPVFDALPPLPEGEAARAAIPALTVAKAGTRARVHRPVHLDLILTPVVLEGRVVAVHGFLGLFAATAYNRNPRSIPWLSSKVQRILDAAGAMPESHDERALRFILDTWPRDELFQAGEAEILAAARRVLDLQLRPRPALMLRRDPSGRSVAAIAWLPRDTFDTRLRERVGRLLAAAFDGRLASVSVALGDGPLARVHYIIATTAGAVPQVDDAVLEAAMTQAARSFADRLGDALARDRGEDEAARLLARWAEGFPPAYREETPAALAVADLRLAEEAIGQGRLAARIERAPGDDGRRLTLRLVRPGGPLPLADALPLFEALDLRALEEVPHRLSPAGASPAVLHVFTLEAGCEARPERFPALLAALEALLTGRAEADGFNRLVLRAGLDWRECWLLRAMFRWLKQVGFAFSQEAVTGALAAQPEAARLLVDLFNARFDPARPRDEAAEAALARRWDALLEANADPDADRIFTRLRRLLDAVLRTNYFQERDRLVLKIDSAAAGEMPLPRPWREIFVHAAAMEGCHLRAGPVARGGIRWSDRREDFRTEILGLMKAQRLKNVVIVPTGAKGGFVLKGAVPTDREGFMAAGQAAYRQLVRGMLDVTDNYGADGAVVVPDRVVRRDGDDPYIVAAADKGTATFSDIANGISAEYGFWLGDAFASGGSQGYDHKAMGITAKGAWVMIARHFREMGHDIQAEPFTVAGVGDMSGDVFGNGLLVSRKTRLVAAFDHRHIFLDPDPDLEASYDERERLFRLPRSSWADYEARRISEGGGVFPRNAKFLPLSPQAQKLLGIAKDRAEPAEVMKAILTLDVDLLYFGGIGTYVKGSGETQAEAGDRANDALRVNGNQLRARVLGEGANLGITQAGRIEAARAHGDRPGVRLNTDALDNSAGVSTSDHEVNIKILLADATASGALTMQGRDALLAEMTGELAGQVLADNVEQSLAVSLEEAAGADALPAHALLMTRLESAGLLDRAVAGLPDAAAMAARIAAGDALTRPEIAALLPVAKLWLTDAIEASELPDDPALRPLLVEYFPTPLRRRFSAEAQRHRLRRELIATVLGNLVANRIGPAGLARLTAESDPATAARAAWLAGALFRIDAAADAIDRSAAPWPRRRDALLALRTLQETAARGLLTGREMRRPLDEALDGLLPGTAALVAAVPAGEVDPLLPPEPARLVAAAPALLPALGVLRLAAAAGAAPGEAARAWAEAGRRMGLDALRGAAQSAPAGGAFGARARAALLDELDGLQARFARVLLEGRDPAAGAEAALTTAREAASVPDLAAVTVALRVLARLPG